ncbi:threonine synthase [Pseudomonas kribbensis]|uniref:Threonine synthase n=1 Tax=Pseudomonas kribbensis TaxID=1628086 RepID=A0A345RL89_9PSED|nr:pyridoxal-phosphate dependent enzyme [Pseudomonas kribbensis]AXI60055.1 threonine synthase [Pseudomonas kribbensis]
MDYVSTRGSIQPANFRSVVLSGLASDGGLYVPNSLPHFDSEDIANWSWLPFDELALRVISPFVGGEIESAVLKSMLKDCYQRFDHRAVAPLQQIGPNEWVLQLHHGPTQASKDFAAQLQSRLVAHFLTLPDRAIVIGATNGDTGLAAVEAFKDVANVEVVALYPRDGVPADRLAGLKASSSGHVRLIEVDGSFDDCQTLVSRVLRAWPLDDVIPISFNSTNWVGVLAQIVFFFHSALQLGGGIRPVGFSIPGASFAEIYACFIAQKMGLAINQVIVSTNTNDALHRFINQNSYSTREVSHSLSPSMDFSLFSNLERFIWELYDRDGRTVQHLMANFEDSGKLSIGNKQWLQARMLFDSYAVADDQVREELLTIFKEAGTAVDPQTATGALAARLHRRSIASPMVTLAQLAPSKSSQLLAELGVWNGDVAATPTLSVDHVVLSEGDIDGLTHFLQGV